MLKITADKCSVQTPGYISIQVRMLQTLHVRSSDGSTFLCDMTIWKDGALGVYECGRPSRKKSKNNNSNKMNSDRRSKQVQIITRATLPRITLNGDRDRAVEILLLEFMLARVITMLNLINYIVCSGDMPGPSNRCNIGRYKVSGSESCKGCQCYLRGIRTYHHYPGIFSWLCF